MPLERINFMTEKKHENYFIWLFNENNPEIP